MLEVAASKLRRESCTFVVVFESRSGMASPLRDPPDYRSMAATGRPQMVVASRAKTSWLRGEAAVQTEVIRSSDIRSNGPS